MKICTAAGNIEKRETFYAVETNAAQIRIWFLTDDILRIRVGFDGDWDEASYSLVMTAWDSRTDALLAGERRRVTPARSWMEDLGEHVYLHGKNLCVDICRNPFLISVYDNDGTLLHQDIPDLSFRVDSNGRRLHTSRIEDDDCFYGFGEQTGKLNKAQEYIRLSPGDAMGYDPEKTESLYKHIPFYIRLLGSSRKALGYYYECTAECSFNMGRQRRNYWHHYSTFCADSGDIDLFLIAGPSMKDVIRRYTDLTGKSAMLPRRALGYLGSSMYYSELPRDCDRGILKFIDTAEKEQIPVDGFQLSSGYCAVQTQEGIKRCSFTWNHDRFPDPAGFFAAMKKKGILVSPNIKPGMLTVHPLLSEMKEKEMFVRASEDAGDSPFAVGTWWGGRGLFVDFTEEKTRKHWKEYIRNTLLAYGCESIWNDNCEYDSITDLDSQVSFEGKGGTIGSLKSVMANLMCMLSNEAIVEYSPDTRPFTVCRAGHAGIQRYAQTWAGDNATCFETLRCNISTILGMGLSGVAEQGCDVGGFYGPAPDPELFLRWVQMGIFMPRFSIHSANTDGTVTEPWMYPEVTPAIRRAIQFRYRLSPYFYSLMYRSHETGLPIMEALCIVFQNDPEVFENGVDFMLGESLFVCPVAERGARTRTVYFPKSGNPAERFYDFNTGKEYLPGSTACVPAGLDTVPLFIRSGAILPLSAEPLMHMDDPVRTLELLLAPDIDSEFTLYEDDGKSNDYKKGIYRKTEIAVSAGRKTVIRFSSEGSYRTGVRTLQMDVIRKEGAPFSVSAKGQALPRCLYGPDYEECERGWYYDMGKGSVQIRMPYPERDFEVEISSDPGDLIGM